MSQIQLNSQLPTQHSSKSRSSQYLACVIISLGGFLGGYVTGWSSPALSSIEEDSFFDVTTSQLSLLTAIVNVGSAISAPTAGYFIRKFGRKTTLLFSSAPFILGWTALTCPMHIWFFYVGRILTGLGLGWMVISSSVYLSETSEPYLRGRLSVMFFVAIRLGILFAYGIGSILPYDQLSAIPAFLSVIFAVSVLFLPESPRWLMTQWRIQKAVDSLCWLRDCEKNSPSPEILAEIEEIKEAVIKSEKESKEMTFIKFLTNGTVLKSIMIASTLMLFRELSGGNVFSYYTVQIFERTGSALDSHLSGVIVGVAQLVALLLTTHFVDKVGRRLLLILTCGVMSISLIFLGLFTILKTELNLENEYFGWIPLITFLIYNAANSGGPFVLTWTVTSEVIPTNIIGLVSGIVLTLSWNASFLLSRFYEDMNETIGVSTTFWVYAGLSGLGAFCVYKLVPETVGRTLENIHKMERTATEESGV